MSGSKPDDYESQYMGGGEALFRDRRGIPRWMHLLFALPALVEVVTGVALLASGNGVGLVNLGILLPLLLLWTLFLYLRITLTPETLHVQYGLFGPKIPVSQIRSVDVGKYDWKKFGGWGIRRGREGWAYSTPGGTNECVTIHWVDDKGKPVQTTITTDEAEALARLLRERIAGAATAPAASSTGVRADTAAPAVASPEPAAEEEFVHQSGARRKQGA